jgi:hypothetical protein
VRRKQRSGYDDQTHVDAVDWHAVAMTLDEIEKVLVEAQHGGADTIARLRSEVTTGNHSSALARLNSGDMWNHMGSFFDRSLSNEVLDRRFRSAQIRLADALEAAKVANTDVSQHAAMLRSWEAEGL